MYNEAEYAADWHTEWAHGDWPAFKDTHTDTWRYDDLPSYTDKQSDGKRDVALTGPNVGAYLKANPDGTIDR